jgi:hypothetical protein
MPGAAGHFLSLAILSLTKDINLVETFRGHKNVDDINHNHNWGNQWNPMFQKFTNIDTNILLETRIRYIQQNFEFYPTDNELYVVHTHATNSDPLMMSFDNTKLINISNTDNERSQLAYNWITKSAFLHNQWDILNAQLDLIKKKHYRLLDIPQGSINEKTPIKLLTYIQTVALESIYQEFINHQFHESYKDRVLTFQFSDILNKNIINQIDNLISFLGIKVSKERKDATIKMLSEYADNQTKFPWIMNVNSFD